MSFIAYNLFKSRAPSRASNRLSMTAHHPARTAAALLLVTLFTPRAGSSQRSGPTIATERIFEAIGVAEGLTVCEIGAGDGELSIAAARLAGPAGRVFTSELGESRVRSLEAKVASAGLERITVVSGDPLKTNFPDARCDALFMRDVYHHFEEPVTMDRSIAAALKPGGRVAVVDFVPPGAEAPRPADRDTDGMHGVTPESVQREMKEAGLDVVSSESGDGRWFMVVAAKPKPHD